MASSKKSNASKAKSASKDKSNDEEVKPNVPADPVESDVIVPEDAENSLTPASDEPTVVAESDDAADTLGAESSDPDDTVMGIGPEDTVIDDTTDPDTIIEGTVTEDTVAAFDDTVSADPTSGDSAQTYDQNTTPAAPVPALTEKRRSVFWPLVLGGLVAGIIGFAVSELDLLNRNTAGADITNQLRSDLSAQQDRLTALEEAEPPVIEPVDLSELEEQLAALDARIVTLEERPIVTVPEGVDADAAAAYAEELSALKSSVEEQRAEIADLLNNARSVEEATAEAAKVANAQASLAKIISAIDAGQPFATELEALKTFDIGEVPDALDAAAPDGVRTLAALQAEFPDEARGALAAARSVPTDEDAQGFSGFFKRQLGVRSTRPREGTDPDAVLSRAEAAVRSGDLDEALAELETLPAPAQDTIAEWRAAADARLAARSAAADLSQRLTAD